VVYSRKRTNIRRAVRSPGVSATIPCWLMLVVPLVGAGEAIGAITLRRSEVRPFTDRQIELLQTFADQAVIAVASATLKLKTSARPVNHLVGKACGWRLHYLTAKTSYLM
jgi:GAF domain